MRHGVVEVAIEQPALLGEGPLWRADEQALWFCDIPARRIVRFEPATGVRRDWTFHADVGSFAPIDGEGAFIVALRDGLWRFDPATDERTRLADAPYDTTTQRFNDGKCDPAGRFWVGSMDEPRRPGLASLWCFDGGRLERRQGGITISNGLAWSPDGRTMYWADTFAHAVLAFDFDVAGGAMTNRRELAVFSPRSPGGAVIAADDYGGRPDGAAVDAEGCYWVAMFEGGRVLRLSPAGETLAEVRLPARCPTMPCFGGADLCTVYVTSASAGRPERERERWPHPGATFSFRVDVPGLPVQAARLR